MKAEDFILVLHSFSLPSAYWGLARARFKWKQERYDGDKKKCTVPPVVLWWRRIYCRSWTIYVICFLSDGMNGRQQWRSILTQTAL